MSFIEQYRCDICGKIKGDVNCWWLWEIDSISFVVRPWDDPIAKHMSHACGYECITKAVNKFMQEQMSAVQGAN